MTKQMIFIRLHEGAKRPRRSQVRDCFVVTFSQRLLGRYPQFKRNKLISLAWMCLIVTFHGAIAMTGLSLDYLQNTIQRLNKTLI
jgi:hypothetical protein